jgi:hypothetical protein
VIAQAADRYQPIVIKAMDIMEDLLDDPDGQCRFKAAQIILCMSPSFRVKRDERLMPGEVFKFMEPPLEPKVG